MVGSPGTAFPTIALALHVDHGGRARPGVEAEQLAQLALHAVRGVGVTEQRQADQGVEVQIPRVVGWSAGALGIEQRRRVDVGVARVRASDGTPSYLPPSCSTN
jgi:hypothetical protein